MPSIVRMPDGSYALWSAALSDFLDQGLSVDQITNALLEADRPRVEEYVRRSIELLDRDDEQTEPFRKKLPTFRQRVSQMLAAHGPRYPHVLELADQFSEAQQEIVAELDATEREARRQAEIIADEEQGEHE